MKIKIKALLLAALMLFVMLPTFFSAETSALSMSVEFNGKQISVSPSPVLSETGEVLVPLKQIFELLNATVTWHAENETLSVYSKDGIKTTLSAECLTANIHGTATRLPSKPVMLNDTLYGQLNILSTVLSCTTTYNFSTGVISINDTQDYSKHIVYVGASNFYDCGGWIFEGTNALRSTDSRQTAKAKFKTEKASTYTVYVLSKDFKYDRPGTRHFKMAVDGTYSSNVFGKHGADGYKWESAGSFSLDAGEHEIMLYSNTAFARCQGIILTNDATYVPTDDFNEYSRYSQRTSAQNSLIPANFPRWATKDISETATETISNDKFKIVFYKGEGDKGALVQNEIFMKRDGAWVAVKGRNEELGVLALRALSTTVAQGCPPVESLSGLPSVTTAEQTLEGFDGAVTIYNEKSYYEMGRPEWLIPSDMVKNGSNVKLTLNSENLSGSMTFFFDSLTEEPKVTFKIRTKTAGCYSFIYFNGDEFSDTDFDRVTAPFNYTQNYIPADDIVLEEYMMFTPMATFTFNEGTSRAFTKGIVVDPSCVRQYVARPGDLDYGVMFRTPTGNARAQLVAPVFTTEQCKFDADEVYSFSYRLLFNDADWYENYVHVAQDIFNCVDLRTNYFSSLNDAIYNTTDLIMDDVYSGFIEKDMAFANMEASGVATISNNLEVMQRYMLTENEEILDKRAIPLIAFMLSRSGTHFTRTSKYNSYTGINVPTPLKGPGKGFSGGSYIGFYRMSQGRMPFMLQHAASAASGGGISASSYGTAMNDLLKTDTFDSKVTSVADNYLNQLKNNSFAPVGGFVYSNTVPALNVLVSAYEETGEQKYLDGAEKVAQYIMTTTWTTGYQNDYATTDYTVDPESTSALRLANDAAEWFYYEDGVQWRIGNDFGVVTKASEAKNKITKETAPGWVPARAGLGTEHRMTPANANAIHMNMWAGTMMRLAKYTGDEFFLTQARNAMIGRYANYSGYYSERYLLHDKKANYPYDGPDYNLIYWHHIPVFLGMLEDFLINNIWYRSNANIEFPSVLQSGYAYFDSNQYGFDSGKFYDEEDMWLWLDRGIVQPDSVEVDYLPAKKEGVLGVAFVNEGSDALTTTVTLGEKIPNASSYSEKATLYDADGNKSTVQITNGKFTLTIPARGILSVVLHPDVKKPGFVREYEPLSYLGETVQTFTDGKAYLLQFNDENFYAYMYTDRMKDTTKSATFTYQYNGKNYSKTVNEYPFETIVKVPATATEFEFSVKTSEQDGTTVSLGGGSLKPLSASNVLDDVEWVNGFPKDTMFISVGNLTKNEVQPGSQASVAGFTVYQNGQGNFGFFTPNKSGKYYVYGLRSYNSTTGGNRQSSININDMRVDFTTNEGADSSIPNFSFFWCLGTDAVELEAGVPFVLRQNKLGDYDRLAGVALVPALSDGTNPMLCIPNPFWKSQNIPENQESLNQWEKASAGKIGDNNTYSVTVNGEVLSVKAGNARIKGINSGVTGRGMASLYNAAGDAISYATVFDALAVAPMSDAYYGSPDVPETFTSMSPAKNSIGTYGSSVRVSVSLTYFPFDVYENSLTGLRVTGDLVHKTDGTTVKLDGLVMSNELRTTGTVLNVEPPEGFVLSSVNSYTLTNLVISYSGFESFDINKYTPGEGFGSITVLLNGVPCYDPDRMPIKNGDVIKIVKTNMSNFKPIPLPGLSEENSALLGITEGENGNGIYLLSADALSALPHKSDFSALNGTRLFGLMKPIGENWAKNVSEELDLQDSVVVFENAELTLMDGTDENGNPYFMADKVAYNNYTAADYLVEKDGKVYLNPYKVGGAGGGAADYASSSLFLGGQDFVSGVFVTKASNNRFIVSTNGFVVFKIITLSYDENGKVESVASTDDLFAFVNAPYIGHAKENQKIFIWGAKVLQEPTFKPLCEPLSF